MKKITFTVLSLLLVLVVVVAFTNCNDAPALSSSLSLRFAPETKARTLEPTLDLNEATLTYDISGTGPNGEEFSEMGITAGTKELKNLVPGVWTVIAKGRNIDNIIIVQSEPTAINLKNGNNELTLSLLPLAGTGTFNLGLSWPVDSIDSPVIVATLTPDGGTPVILDFTISGLSASIAPLTLARGYYTLSVKLNDATYGGYLVWSKVEEALIYADADTSKNWVLVKETDMHPQPLQNLGLTLNVDTKSPIEMLLSGVTSDLTYGTDMTVTASGTPVPTTWKWFLNADELVGQTTSSVTLGADLDEKTLHTLTVIGRKGDIAGSTDAIFRVGVAPIIIDPVDLKTAGNYVILAQSGITGGAGSTIVGDIGASPVTSTAITGFSLALDPSGLFSTSEFVTGSVFASDYVSPTPTTLNQAVLDSDAAYAEAATRVSLDVVNDLDGEIGGKTLVPGLYSWTSAVSINTNLTLDGPANGVWIFQIAGSLTEATNIHVNLSGGALPENIFWQVGGGVTLGANAHMEGVVLSETAIVLGQGATVKGRLYAKTAVTLDASTVTQP